MKPDLDYVTRDRDGRAVAEGAILRIARVGRAWLDLVPDGYAFSAVPSGPRLSREWLPRLDARSGPRHEQ